MLSSRFVGSVGLGHRQAPLLMRRGPGAALSRRSISHSAARCGTAVFGWGDGTLGQLGHERFVKTSTWKGDHYTQEDPRRLVKSKHYAALACGRGFSLGLTEAGDVFGWGHGFAGKESQSNVPLPIDTSATKALGRTIVQIAAGAAHCAAIDSAGQVLTWGDNGGWYDGGGQLGHGNLDSLDVPTYVAAFEEHGQKAAQMYVLQSQSQNIYISVCLCVCLCLHVCMAY